MNNRLAQLASAVSLADEIARPTEIKETVAPVVDIVKSVISTGSDFLEEETPIPAPIIPIEQQNHPVIEEEEEYDAEKAARSLIYTLTAVDQLVLNIAVLLKSRYSVGGSKAIEKMKVAITKEFAGEELTDHDKKLIARMKEYKANMEALSGEMIIKPDEMKRLIEVATDWCEETKFKIGSGTALFANYVGTLVERTTKIIMN
jgi:hypothetical protein